MACKSHRIYGEKDSFNFYNESYNKYRNIFTWDKLQHIEEYPILEREILNKKPQIVLVSSGMVCGGYSNAVASGMLPHENSSILFCGYQGLGSTGRKILESEFGDTIKIDNKDVKRKCNIDFMNMSSHADYKRIISMIASMRHTKIKKICLNHGDVEALEFFKKELQDEFQAEVIVSDYDKWIKLT
jgi:metallo-beta-lactamase family protein